jgi:GNAT superfamily N-acetyltransferase
VTRRPTCDRVQDHSAKLPLPPSPATPDPSADPSPDPVIRRARVGDVTAAAGVVAAAFADLDASAWLVPEIERRRQVLADVFSIVVAHAEDVGVVHLLTTPPPPHAPPIAADGPGMDFTPVGGQVLAAAVWITRTRPIPAPPDYERRLHVSAGRDVARFRRLDELFDQHHPFEPHAHLAFLATHPDHQGRGFGTRLLQHRIRALDATQTAAYLEAAGTRTLPFYARHRFVPLGRDFTLPNGATFTPMWRDPEPIT